MTAGLRPVDPATAACPGHRRGMTAGHPSPDAAIAACPGHRRGVYLLRGRRP